MVNHYSLIISDELNIMRKHISATLRMLDEGATVPFIARYRKEATGSLDEVTVQKIKLRYDELKEFSKDEISSSMLSGRKGHSPLS